MQNQTPTTAQMNIDALIRQARNERSRFIGELAGQARKRASRWVNRRPALAPDPILHAATPRR